MDEEVKKKSSSDFSGELILVILVIILVIGIFGTYFGSAFDWYGQGLGWLTSAWHTIRRTLQIIMIMITISAIGFIVTMLNRLFDIRRALEKAALYSPEEASAHTIPLTQETEAAWEGIRSLANSTNPSDWNMAILRADALIDDVLSHQGYEGTTLAERLKIADPIKLTSLDSLWSAHRLRNTIAHDPLMEHTRETVMVALRSYEASLKELGTLGEKKS